MHENLNDIIQTIKDADNTELKSRWLNLFHKPAPRQISSPMMRRMLAYGYQECALGGLSAREERSLIASLKPKSTQTPKYLPGTKFLREWQGVAHEVTVLEAGYGWNGQEWRSLSAIAKAITGAHWSGPRFFNVKA